MSMRSVYLSINNYASFLHEHQGALGYETDVTSGHKVSPRPVCVDNSSHSHISVFTCQSNCSSLICEMTVKNVDKHINDCGFCVLRLFRCQPNGLHPPCCLGASSDLQLSMTGSYQGFKARLCRVI